jgi:hypothetical protein
MAATYTAFKMTFPSYSYRYRLQLSLTVNDKTYRGSSVIQVNWECGPPISGLGRCAHYIGGQAPLIDLGAMGVVVATLRDGHNISPIPDGAVDTVWLCAKAFGNRSSYEEKPSLSRLTGRRDLAPDNLPRMVWFKNPEDMTSARIITQSNMASVIHPSARLTEASVEITSDPIVVDIPKRLPWLAELKRQRDAQRGIITYPGRFQLIYNMFVGEAS